MGLRRSWLKDSRPLLNVECAAVERFFFSFLHFFSSSSSSSACNFWVRVLSFMQALTYVSARLALIC